MRLCLLMVCCAFLTACGGREPIQLPEPGQVQEPTWREIPLEESRRVGLEPRRTAEMDDLVHRCALRAVEEIGGSNVNADRIWVTAIDCRDARDPRIGSYRGALPVYPASVVKMCYMVAAYDQNRTRGLVLDDQMRHDLDRMIKVSSNAATSRIVDRLCNTSFGEELDGEAYDSFVHKRQTVYRLMQALGLDGLWAVNKTYDNPVPLYGREMQALGEPSGGNFEYSNKMTTDDTARLLYMVWRRALVDREASEEMLELLRRDEEYRTFFSSVIPEGVTLYSKGGSTGVQRHDAGIFELPGGGALIVVAFSNHLNAEGDYPPVIQRTAGYLLEEVLAKPGERDLETADPDPTIGHP